MGASCAINNRPVFTTLCKNNPDKKSEEKKVQCVRFTFRTRSENQFSNFYLAFVDVNGKEGEHRSQISTEKR